MLFSPITRSGAAAVALGLGCVFLYAAPYIPSLGLPQQALELALVGFNVGVEFGQLAIVAVFLPLAFPLRGTRFYQVGA
jgi:hypothetical protein